MTKLLCSLIPLPLLAGCFGVYAEVAATTLPSATIDGNTNTGETSVGFNLGGEFSSARMRFAIGYASESPSFDGGTGSFGASSSRFDFNVFSVTDRARIRAGLGFAAGTGKATVAGMSQTGNDASGFAGLDFTYFLTWKIAAHAFAGPIYMSHSIPAGTVQGSGMTFRIALSYTFGDIRPDTSVFIPLDTDHDLTGLIETGAQSLGCTARRDSNPSSGYAFLDVRCDGREVLYMQGSSGIMASCQHMFAKECDAFTLRLADATKRAVTAPAPASPPPPPAQPAPPPPPAATPPTPPSPPPAPPSPPPAPPSDAPAPGAAAPPPGN